jgi:outer membrane phospholipase A
MHEDLLGRGIDLWFGYTQQSHWQVFNKGLSAPFRETNYAPEVFLTLPTDYTLFGLRGRFASLGLLHQSNGQSGTLSRSWNRVYAQFGWEYGDRFNLIFQPWYRLKENADDDDNPDIRRHVGDFEAVASYRLGKHTFSLLGRSSFGLERARPARLDLPATHQTEGLPAIHQRPRRKPDRLQPPAAHDRHRRHADRLDVGHSAVLPF